MSVRYEVEVDQSTVVEMIEVKLFQLLQLEQRNSSDGYISAFAKWHYAAHQTAYFVIPNVRISGYFTSDQARDVAEWWAMAGVVVDLLQSTITSRADFDKRWSAKVVGKTVSIEETEKETV